MPPASPSSAPRPLARCVHRPSRHRPTSLILAWPASLSVTPSPVGSISRHTPQPALSSHSNRPASLRPPSCLLSCSHSLLQWTLPGARRRGALEAERQGRHGLLGQLFRERRPGTGREAKPMEAWTNDGRYEDTHRVAGCSVAGTVQGDGRPELGQELQPAVRPGTRGPSGVFV